MGLANALIDIPQSERGGEIAQRGFDYQTCWALSQILEYELDGKDYVFIFEYHDDVLIVDSEDNPQSITFAQVKTREGHWTPNSLYKVSPKDAAKGKISIIAKLFLLQRNFLVYKPSLLFVTNAALKFSNVSGKASFDASSLELKEQESIQREISKQLKITDKLDLSTMKFSQSDLSLEDHSVHLIGKICDFLERKYGVDTSLRAKALAELLTAKCREKSKIKSNDILNFADLVKRKGFSSKAFNTLIDSINDSDSLKPDWEMARAIFDDLNKESLQLIRLQAVFSRVCIELNRNKRGASSVYLAHALSLYSKTSVDLNLNSYLADTISKIDLVCPDYASVLVSMDKECIVVYSIIQKLLEEGEV